MPGASGASLCGSAAQKRRIRSNSPSGRGGERRFFLSTGGRPRFSPFEAARNAPPPGPPLPRGRERSRRRGAAPQPPAPTPQQARREDGAARYGLPPRGLRQGRGGGAVRRGGLGSPAPAASKRRFTGAMPQPPGGQRPDTAKGESRAPARLSPAQGIGGVRSRPGAPRRGRRRSRSPG
jgi:hypothetical protein